MTEHVARDARDQQQGSLGTVLVIATIDVVSLGMMIAVLPALVKELVDGSLTLATYWVVAFTSMWGVLQFTCGPALGLLSDRFGRRPILLMSMFGMSLDFLFMAFAPTLWWLLVGRIINGVTAASLATCSAYVADVTPPERRAWAFGRLGAAWSVGFIVGPAVGGWLAEVHLRLPFLVCAGLAFAAGLMALWRLPESLATAHRPKQCDWSGANPIRSLRLFASRRKLARIGRVAFLYYVADNAMPTLFVLYAGHRFGWDPGATGVALMALGLGKAAVQGLFMAPFAARYGDRRTMQLGLAAGAAGLAVLALATNGLLGLAALPLLALAGLTQPSLQSLMTQQAASHEQGLLQGANAGLLAAATVVGPLAFGLIFAKSAVLAPSTAGGIAMLTAAALMATSLAMTAACGPSGIAAAIPPTRE